MTKKSIARLAKDVPPRPRNEIQTDYEGFCTMAGDRQYKCKVLEQELNNINSKLFSLNQEFAKLDKLESDSLPKASPDETV